MRITVKLLEKNSDINTLILDNIKSYLEPRIKQAGSQVTAQLPPLISDALKQEPEYQSLLSGQLRGELGISDSSVVESIISAISSSIELVSHPIKIGTSGIKGGFSINVIRANDAGGVISLDMSKIITPNYSLPWLEWLLFKGNEILVNNYVVEFGPNPNSRSGLAIMTPSSSNGWRVPPQFVGTEKNNWITRAISRIEDKVYSLITKSIEAKI
jgi:hypothetical protein